MASASPQSPPPTGSPGHESPTDIPESPIIPSPQAAGFRRSPPKPVNLRAVTAVQSTQPRPQGSRAQVKTPEPRPSKERMNGQKEVAERSPSTPGHLAPFDWDDFEARYEEALAEADGHEQELLREFEELVKFFNVWASAASAHDTERGVKRLQTRERYVKIAEQSLAQKKKHLTEVVRAFQSALALLSQS
ncbi:Extracellular mutant protein 11 C-terminal domain-containing protein [Madurella fahalii]|uniref:Extracellular mutant protein 11 C-terminal domain-containing protein n=1 Tax=Madurella fahalii TaxID=1157608 RepID=A0ABQ0FZY9_9PEZI